MSESTAKENIKETMEENLDDNGEETAEVSVPDDVNNSNLSDTELMRVIEAALFSVGQTINMSRLMTLFPVDKHPGKNAIKAAIMSLQEQYLEHTSLELKEVSSGYRFQVRDDYSSWVAKLFEERPARYSRATLETLALITYRQPITRAEIEEVRGVSVSSQIIKTLLEREWIRVVGHRDVPGKPALYSTTKEFLDYFNLKSLDELPPLADLRDIDAINAELDLQIPEVPSAGSEESDDAATGTEMVQDEEPGLTSEVIH